MNSAGVAGIAGAFAAVTLSAAAAQGATSSRLLYSRAPGAETCPDEPALRAAVGRLLGYDPFVAFARTTVVVGVEREGSRIRARTYLDEDGVSRGGREFWTAAGHCDELVAAVALAVSIALDPMSAERPAAAAPPPEEPSEPPPMGSADSEGSTPAAAPPLEPSPQPDRPAAPAPQHPGSAGAPAARAGAVRFDLGFGGFVSVGSLPQASGGPFALTRARLGPWSIDLEARAELPETTDVPSAGARARTWSWGASLAPCFHAAAFAFCATASATEIHAEGVGVSSPMPQDARAVALGARAAAEWPVAAGVSLHVRADGAIPLAPTRLVLNGADAWTSPAIAVAVGLGLLVAVR
jgi:hypothetical protein